MEKENELRISFRLFTAKDSIIRLRSNYRREYTKFATHW